MSTENSAKLVIGRRMESSDETIKGVDGSGASLTFLFSARSSHIGNRSSGLISIPLRTGGWSSSYLKSKMLGNNVFCARGSKMSLANALTVVSEMLYALGRQNLPVTLKL